MARRCPVSGKGVQAGNNVSHANNKTKRRFLPNLQPVSLVSDALGTVIRVRLTTNGLKTVERHGGLDSWIRQARLADLPREMQRLKRRIARVTARRAAA